MTTTLKPIETKFDGYLFRSRLEARWAVYFKTMGIAYEYEKEGFALPYGLGWYLPDFWLPQVEMWAEVKPQPLDSLQWKKCRALALGTKHDCLLLIGPPDVRVYWAIHTGEVDDYNPTHPFAYDYVLDGDYLDEGRFFVSSGYDCDTSEGLQSFRTAFGHRLQFAVDSARAARFEHC